MKKYQAIKYGERNKVKEHYIIYRVAKKGKKYNFCFTLLEHAAFMNSRKSELNGLIEDAIAREPQSQYFEYTGSHFEPVSAPFWLKLPWEIDKQGDEDQILLIKPDISKYSTVGAWYKDMKAQGYAVPLQLCHSLQKIMEKYKFTFSEAFEFLLEKGKILLRNKIFIYDLSGDKLWEETK